MPRRMNWYTGLEILFGDDDSISRKVVIDIINDFDNMRYANSEWESIIKIDFVGYKYDKMLKTFLSEINSECNQIGGIRIEDVINDDKKLISQKLREESHILEYYVEMLECVRELSRNSRKRFQKLMNQSRREWEAIYRIYKTKDIDEDSKETEQNAGKFDEIEWEETLNEFRKIYERFQAVSDVCVDIRDDCLQDMMNWMKKFIYIMKKIQLYRDFEKETDKRTRIKRKTKKAASETLWEEFEKAYRRENPETEIWTDPDLWGWSQYWN